MTPSMVRRGRPCITSAGALSIALLLGAFGCSTGPAPSAVEAPRAEGNAPRADTIVRLADHAEHAGVSADEAMLNLTHGNERYVAGKLEHPDQGISRRAELAQSQHPYAVILSCADSRVPPEIVFDAGLGSLFVVRVAGNVADDAVIGSVEYAVEHLDTSLIVVLGHERCGAVSAAVALAASGQAAPGHLAALVDPIRPAVEKAKKLGGDVVDAAVRENVARVVEQLKASKPVLAERVATGKLRVVGGRYDLDTGVVEFK